MNRRCIHGIVAPYNQSLQSASAFEEKKRGGDQCFERHVPELRTSLPLMLDSVW